MKPIFYGFVCLYLPLSALAMAAGLESDAIEAFELKVLMQSSTSQQFRKTDQLLRSRQAAVQACHIQKVKKTLPLGCYEQLRIEKQMQMPSAVGADLLAQCLAAAPNTANLEISPDMKKLLPQACLQEVLQVVQINRYKAHRNPL